MTSIRRRIMVYLLTGLTVVLIATGAAIYLLTRQVIVSHFDSALSARITALTVLIENERGEIVLETDLPTTSAWMWEQGQSYFEVWSAEDQPIIRCESLKEGDLPLRTGGMDQPLIWDFQMPSGEWCRAAGVRFQPRIEVVEPIVLREGVPTAAVTQPVEVSLVVAISRSELDQTLANVRWIIIAVSALAIGSTMWIVTRSLSGGLSPLTRIGGEIGRIDANSLNSRLIVAGMPAELLPICTRLNELLDRLGQTFERERRLSANLAHELRTPIAELRALSDVALTWPTMDAESTRSFQDAHDIAINMQVIVNNILALARCESRQESPSIEPITAAAFTDGLWRTHRPLAIEKRLRVTSEVPDNVLWLCDRRLLATLLANLLSNAVQYTPSGEWVNYSFTVVNGAGTFTISNPAPELTADDLRCIFEPYWRKDDARSNSQHIGLGLSLAKAIAQVLDLRLTAELNAAGVLIMSLTGLRSQVMVQAQPAALTSGMIQ